MGNKEAVKAKVQQYLTSILGTVTIDSDGDFTVRADSARGFVRVVGNDGDGPTFVSIFVPVLIGVTDSPELHRWVAYRSEDVYGGFYLRQRSDERIDLMLSHVLLGDYLDEPEIGYALTWIMQTANEVDEELQSKFGGARFHEK
ncbi:MAG: hypothetical protein LBD51_08925 [Bifidobacteriaceae bacterium]|jgi:hypothetical protein|nr:hypothetical protein [Bifidobacteriaceae bacterium]